MMKILELISNLLYKLLNRFKRRQLYILLISTLMFSLFTGCGQNNIPSELDSVARDKYEVIYNREGMPYWDEKSDEDADATELLRLTEQSGDAEIIVYAENVNNTNTTLGEYVDADRNRILSENPGTSYSEITGNDDYGIPEFSLVKYSMANDSVLHVYYSFNNGLGLKILCSAKGDLRYVYSREFEEVFLETFSIYSQADRNQ